MCKPKPKYEVNQEIQFTDDYAETISDRRYMLTFTEYQGTVTPNGYFWWYMLASTMWIPEDALEDYIRNKIQPKCSEY